MTYRYQVRAHDSRWAVVDTKMKMALPRPLKTLRGAIKKAVKLNSQSEASR